MARARNIKPAFFHNEELAELSPLERLAFIGMWTIADFKGCIEFRPKRLKVQILPYDDCDFEIIANNLDKSGFISIYSVLSQRYIKILNFIKHQNPHKNERDSGSTLPDNDKNDNSISKLQNIEINLDKDGTARADSLLLIPDSLNPLAVVQPKKEKATRLPKDWIIPQEYLDYCLKTRSDLDVLLIAEMFKNYWTSKPKDATKLDWFATWRNWVMNQDAAKVSKPKYKGHGVISDENFEKWLNGENYDRKGQKEVLVDGKHLHGTDE